ncbi:hypothetical protein TrRE_jg3904 [Triparma retinervis]|uniref:LarA-like N-terminal domain-containing protein n=1 Tax=Triparma retinervis TaxID=2557542 RepID=A0A9W7A652_9STRA|nr:hypothetical protein TrRE_jg3904 [Triparma retinervis]
MIEKIAPHPNTTGISQELLKASIERFVQIAKEKSSAGSADGKVFILPPDFTRFHSRAGEITSLLYDIMPAGGSTWSVTDIMPALGTHAPMSEDQCTTMFSPAINSADVLRVHDWRNDVTTIGHCPASMVSDATNGMVSKPWPAQLNKLVWEGNHDAIFSVGQVVPHEVMGMANFNKNLFVGVGGVEAINLSHFIGAVYGMEKMMGKATNPLRAILNYASENFLQTKLSLTCNFTMLEEPLKKVVVFLDEDEFHSTWLGNKAIYRTRMAIADGGELIVIGPGVKKFGEDGECDVLIRKYGYVGTPAIMKHMEEQEELQNNLSVVAHLIHGSSEGRFSVKYCPGHLTKEEIEKAGFEYGDLEEAQKKYSELVDGWNNVEGERVFYISNPALGLWAHKDRFEEEEGDVEAGGGKMPAVNVGAGEQVGVGGSGGVGGSKA